MIKKILSVLPTFNVKVIFLLQNIRYGKKLMCIGFPYIFKDKNSSILIKDHVSVVSISLGNMLGINHRAIIIAREGGEITIGNHVGISGGTIYSLKKISIGDYVNCGANVKIIDHDFHPLEPNARKTDDRSKIRKAEICIGDNVFIGTDSIILRGTNIGENCIIGAKSVVRGEFPPNCVIAGNPAKIVRELSVTELES